MQRFLRFCITAILATALPGWTQQLPTVPERTGFTSTSRLEDVQDFFRTLAARYPQQMILSRIGLSLEGRAIPLVILGDPAYPDPAENRRPVVLLIGNIHAGEVEGKEALQMLARDLLTPETSPILSRLTILMVPVLNTDGNERIDPSHRPYQRVRNGVGVRTNAMNMDLNRDFVKLESPEVRALVHLFDQWRPLVFVDCHTTNGSYHEEPLTWTWGANANGGDAIHQYIYKQFMPYLHRFVKEHHQIRAIPYGNFDNPFQPKTWGTFSNRIVYGVSYFGVKGAFSFLNENYAYANFPTRIRACYAFLDGVLTFTDTHRTDMLQLVNAYREQVPPVLATHVTPRAFPEPIVIQTYEMERDQTGRARPTSRKKTVTVRYMGDFRGKTTPIRGAYVFPPGLQILANRLAAHGIHLYRLTKEHVAEVRVFHLDNVQFADRPFQGHIMMSQVTGNWRTENRHLPDGWFVVPLGRTQPYRQLAVVLLEPESEDSLFRYGLLNTMIYPSQWRPTTGDYPVYRIDGTNGMPMEIWHGD